MGCLDLVASGDAEPRCGQWCSGSRLKFKERAADAGLCRMVYLAPPQPTGICNVPNNVVVDRAGKWAPC